LNLHRSKISRRRFIYFVGGAGLAVGVAVFGVGNYLSLFKTINTSYIIFNAGPTYKAVNGTTGVEDYSDADLATVINDASTALTGGGDILIKQGAYSLARRINIAEGKQRLHAEHGAVMTVTAAYSDTVLIATNGKDDVYIEDLYIDGNGANQSNRIYHIYANGGANVYIRNNTILNHHGDAIHSDNTTHLHIERNVLGPAQAGLATVYAPHIFSRSCNYVWVEDNRCAATVPTATDNQDSIQAEMCSNFHINGNTVIDASDAGIEVDGTGGSSTRGEIRGNVILNAGNYAMEIDDHIGDVGCINNICYEFGTNAAGLGGIFIHADDTAANNIENIEVASNVLDGKSQSNVSAVIVSAKAKGADNNIHFVQINNNTFRNCSIGVRYLNGNGPAHARINRVYEIDNILDNVASLDADADTVFHG
jgi:hypothetical protein